MLRRALTTEQLALMRFQDTFQHFSALSRLWIGDANPRNAKALLGIPLRECVAHPKSGLRDKTETSPLEVRPQLENFAHGSQRRPVPLPRDDSLVLVLDLRFARLELPQ